MLVKLLKATQMMVMVFNPASGSKQDTGLLQIANPTTLPTTLQESDTPDQSGASSFADSQPEKDCTDEHGIRKVSKSCPQAAIITRTPVIHFACSPQSDEMSLPVIWESQRKNPTVETRKLTSTLHLPKRRPSILNQNIPPGRY
ncbi:hypothetical protein BASA60_009708 [Batrachochytrium salamandrivorans]|nr:hypothetical protein BASA60_009708 [Batrachochytrium salamandrivorans]